MDNHILIACTGALLNMALSVSVPYLIGKSKQPFLKDIKEVYNLHRQLIVTSSLIVALIIYLALKITPDTTPNLHELASLNLNRNYDYKFNRYSLTNSDLSELDMDMPSCQISNFNRQPLIVENNIPYNFSEQYFKNYPAISVDSKAYLIKSKANYLNLVDKEDDKEKLIGDIQKSIADLWVDSDFSSEDEKKFLADYGDKLTKIDHIRRVDRLLWDGKIGDASKMLYIVDEDYAKLFSVIIEISKNPAHIDDLVLSVPRRLRGNEGLYYRRILFYKAKGQHDDAVDATGAFTIKRLRDLTGFIIGI